MPALIAVAAMSLAADDQFPVVSPDGSRIAFLSQRDGTDDLYVMNSDGNHVLRLTQTPEAERQPSWSADGKAVRFSVWDKDSSRMYAVDAEGGNVNEIGKVQGRSVAISADGKRDLHALGTWTAVQLIESDLDGTHPRQLSDGSSVVWSPRWSPDGKTIAFTGRDAKGILHIYLMDADGSKVRQLTHFDPADGQAQCPAWSPDGRQLAVQANTKDSAHVWIVDAKSGAARKLASHAQAFLDELPSWFPDGKRVAFQSNRGGRMAIWTMSIDGSDPRQLSSVADRNAVLDAVQTALDAWRQADGAKLESVLDPAFRELTLHLRDGTWELGIEERGHLIGTMSRIEKGMWDDRLLDPQVMLDGPIAVVWSHYRFSGNYVEGGVRHTPVHCGIATFQLYRIEGRWRIATFADTHADCN